MIVERPTSSLTGRQRRRRYRMPRRGRPRSDETAITNDGYLRMAHCSWRTTSWARLSPRMISTVGGSRLHGRRRSARSATPAATRVRATAVRVGAPKPSSAAGRMPLGHRHRLVERVAQRELNLAFGAGQRQPLGLFRVDQERDDAHRHRLVACRPSRSIFVPAASTCTLVSTTFDVMSSCLPVGLTVATHVDARARAARSRRRRSLR